MRIGWAIRRNLPENWRIKGAGDEKLEEIREELDVGSDFGLNYRIPFFMGYWKGWRCGRNGGWMEKAGLRNPGRTMASLRILDSVFFQKREKPKEKDQKREDFFT